MLPGGLGNCSIEWGNGNGLKRRERHNRSRKEWFGRRLGDGGGCVSGGEKGALGMTPATENPAAAPHGALRGL